jgi:hypothetical protein
MAKQRHNNQVRVVAPESDGRLKRIAEALIRSGLPDALSAVLAEGFVALLRRRVWTALDDVVGGADDVEALLGWQGPPRDLAYALQREGYVRDINGVLVAVDAVTEAPEYIKARWRRGNLAGYEAARGRATDPNIIHQREEAPTGTDREDTTHPGTLFGVAADQPGESADVRKPKKSTTPGFDEFKRYWHARYTEETGNRYPWQPADFKHVERIVKAVRDARAAANVADAYFRCREPFYAGHSLGKLVSALPRFVEAAGTDSDRGHSPLASQARTDAARL